MSAKDDRFFNPEEAAVIREVYDNENAHDVFAEELERALDASAPVIVIEPHRLGDETARWIAVGNCLHKTAVITGIGAVASGLAWPNYPYTWTPLAAVSFFCTSLYTVAWQFDPCVKYQVFTDSKRLSNLPLFSTLSSTSPVVLVRTDDTRTKLLHCSVTLAATALAAFKLYRLFR
ncbi:transmembrane protein 11 [Nesidiocoris tenuis]|uniref:Transmembrane protein 11 n=1 Tax=Nesidiocoris tenuis TaxID=355587 RepID=A0ABN7AWF5_9HEMI|nr:transmembrane protein 11 [Nesidiocoris tenuis]